MGVSLYESAGMCCFGARWGHGTDVPWTGMCTAGFDNSTRLLLRVAGTPYDGTEAPHYSGFNACSEFFRLYDLLDWTTLIFEW